jgi:carbonic anhydrase/acetyltransferase-like protein (isoleucine patch superfamily)/uncharacterized damage-inducible protein DinB
MDWPARLRLDPTAFVAPSAVVVGDVTLGPRSSVWFGTVLRGDIARIEVGEATNLQDGTIVHVDEGEPALIGARVTVGHRAVVHGCQVEDECLVGMGAILLTGARVGTGSLIAAGSLVRERQVVPPGSVAVGVPAKVVGQVTAAHREAIRRGHEHYAALARSYVERGFAGPHAAAGCRTGIAPRPRGPMSFHEWGQLLADLAEGPDWAADRLERNDEALWRRSPAPGRWSALEVLCHLRDVDTDLWLPRLELLLAGSCPDFPAVATADWAGTRRYAEQSPARVLEEWAAARRRLLARLAPLARADWERTGIHPVRGPFPLGELVRHCADHDLSHRRQMADALGEFA